MAYDASSFLTPWLTFYGMTGASAATLTGLMFVVITLVSGEQRPTSADAGSTFTTPTVMHFGAALLVSALLVAPWHSFGGPVVLLGIAGLYGTFHMARVTIKATRLTMYRPDAEDWTWYAILPAVAYLTLLVGAIVLPASPGVALFVFAAAVVMLIFIGIRNSWDVVTYITVGRGDEPPPPGTS
jgi:hypothetical protein